MKKIDIVLPIYNEEQAIEKFHSHLSQQLKSYPYEFRINYVLDKCPDNTEQVVRRICSEDSKTSLIVLSNRFGYQNSIMAGLKHTKGEAVIIMDADMEHPPSVIGEMLEKFEQGFEVVHTQRTYSGHVSWFKKTTSNYFYRLLQFLSDTEINPDSDEFKLLKRNVVEVFQNDIHEQNLYLRGLFNWVGFNSTTIFFTSGERAAGISKFTVKALFRLAFNGILSLSKFPLVLTIYTGLTASALSLIYGIYLIIRRIMNPNLGPPGWAEIIVTILFMSGVQLIFLGVIAQYVGAIFDEVKGRPRFIVKEIVNQQKH